MMKFLQMTFSIAVLVVTSTGCTSHELTPNVVITTSSPIPATSLSMVMSTPYPKNTPVPANGLVSLAVSGQNPHLVFWYLDNGKLFRYNTSTWSSEFVAMPSQGRVKKVVISQDTSKLAFADDRGLKIINLDSNTTESLFSNSTSQEQYKYFPYEWSPDGHWLWIGKEYDQNIRYILADPVTNASSFFDCYFQINWLSGQDVFVGTRNITYDENCENDGIFLVSRNKNGALTEKKIYDEPISKQYHRWEFINVSPQGNQLVVVQSYHDEAISHYWLDLISITGQKTKELVASQQVISFPVWSKSGTDVYYVERTKNVEKVYKLAVDTLDKQELYASVEGQYIVLFAISSDGKWLAFGTMDSSSIIRNIGIINIDTGIAASLLSAKNPDTGLSWVGWEPPK